MDVEVCLEVGLVNYVTEGTNSVKTVGILNTVQFKTFIMPFRPQALLPELLLCTPGDIVDYLGN